MGSLFQTRLVNGTTGDPALYIDGRFRRRALMFDLGDIGTLAPRHVLRVTDIFVSHAHMDHFIGFDRVLRLMLGRARHLRLYGPPGFVECVAHRMLGYTWNLVANYPVELVIEAAELQADGTVRRAAFRSRDRFARRELEAATAPEGVLLDEEDFRVRAVHLDHSIPCLGFALEEKAHLNVWKSRLDELGLPTGPWLSELKRLVRQDASADTPLTIAWSDRAGRAPPGAPARAAAPRGAAGGARTDDRLRRGRGLSTTEPARDHRSRPRRGPVLRGGAVPERGRRARGRHLPPDRRTGRAPGPRGGVKRVIPFHFSPRHTGEEARLEAQVQAAFLGIDSRKADA
jgi:ribonuclease Z